MGAAGTARLGRARHGALLDLSEPRFLLFFLRLRNTGLRPSVGRGFRRIPAEAGQAEEQRTCDNLCVPIMPSERSADGDRRAK